ncbi:MAG: Peptidase and in, kexin, sedolisin [Gemmatimonadetes bacterium]|nr:Peptidase and in, kexin, sedolisin [Gemmatimonadota bacterium]
MSESALPPEERARVKQFEPVDLDRTVIAVPLLREMKEDFDRIELLRSVVPTALREFNAAIEYSVASPEDLDAARRTVQQLVAAATEKALAASEQRLARASDESREREMKARAELMQAVREQTVEPPLLGYPYSLARLHSSVIRRTLAANARMNGPIAHVYPKRFEVIIDLNLTHRGGRAAARQWVIDNIERAKSESEVRDGGQGIHYEKDQPSSQYLFARLEARAIRKLVELDIDAAKQEADLLRASTENPALRQQIDPRAFRAIFHIWPDFDVSACIFKSIATVKCDAAQNAFSASGAGITWAVMDSGIKAEHQHFKRHANVDPRSTLHKDFTVDGDGPFADENGHGTHVAGIIAGEWRVAAETPDAERPLAISRYLKTGSEDVEILETRLEGISGMAPKCKLVSLRVLDENGKGSVSNLIAAINHVQEINGYGRHLLIHGVNMSLGYNFEPEWFACGQSPLCTEVDRLVKSGVVVVVAAGNTGYGTLKSTIGGTTAGMALTINDPGNADLAITVGSTHRDSPHVYGVSYFSSKGPTGDGRLKPDVVAPGEKIISCAAGMLKSDAAKGQECDYVETSGTSMAAPHVSGAIAAFLSVRGEFIGKAEQVKQIFVSTATDLRRERTFQGAGLVDLMRAIQSV